MFSDAQAASPLVHCAPVEDFLLLNLLSTWPGEQLLIFQSGPRGSPADRRRARTPAQASACLELILSSPFLGSSTFVDVGVEYSDILRIYDTLKIRGL